MKRIIMFVILTFVIKFFTGCTGSTIFFNYGYNVSGNKVYYKNAFPNGTIEIKGADAKTFKIIFQPGNDKYNSNTDFATDKNYAYYGGSVIPGSDGNSFSILSRDFSKDKNQCYFHGKIIPNADPISFTVKDETFSADKNNVYKGIMLMDNNTSVFESFDSSTVVHTANAVSILETIIPLRPQAKFKYVRFDYFAVDDQVYFEDKPIPDANIASFKALDGFFSTTSKHVYYSDKIIENAHPSTYKLLPGPYGKDDKHVFFFENTIEGADPNSFEILNINFQCGRDKNWAYHEDKRIKNVTAEDMANKKPCRQCNEESIYFDEK